MLLQQQYRPNPVMPPVCRIGEVYNLRNRRAQFLGGGILAISTFESFSPCGQNKSRHK